MREDWKYSTIGESCNINYGTRVVRKRDGGSIYDVYGGGGATFKMDTYNREDCLVVSRFAMSPKCTRFVSGKFFLNDSGLTLSPKKDTGLSQAFMNTILLANNDNIYKYGRGSAQRNLKVDEFCTMPISYPKSLTEQERIVALLDDQFAKIDALKANAASQLQAAKDLFQSALKEMLTPKEGWECGCLGKFLNFRRGHDLTHAEMIKGNIPVAGSSGIIGYHNEATPMSPCITVGRSGSVGKLNIYKVCWAHNTTLYIDDYKGNDPYFLAYLIQSLGIASYGGGSAVPTLNRNYIHPIKTAIPKNVVEQEHIAARLDTLSEKVKALQANYDQTINLCNDLKQALLKSIFE
jgi:type I restriction enzyme S subunit